MVGRPSWYLVGLLTLAMVVIVATWPKRMPVARPSTVQQRCPTDEQTLVDRANLIITGRIFAVIPFGRQAEVLITPLRLYRGTIPDRGVSIVTAVEPPRNLAGPAVGNKIRFQTGQLPYVLYLQIRSDDRFTVDPCSQSRILVTGLTSTEQDILGDGRAVDEASSPGIQ